MVERRTELPGKPLAIAMMLMMVALFGGLGVVVGKLIGATAPSETSPQPLPETLMVPMGTRLVCVQPTMVLTGDADDAQTVADTGSVRSVTWAANSNSFAILSNRGLRAIYTPAPNTTCMGAPAAGPQP